MAHIIGREISSLLLMSTAALKMTIESSFVRLFYGDVTICPTDAEQMKQYLGENTTVEAI